MVSLGDCGVSHAASSQWTIMRVVPKLGGAPDGNPQAVRDAGLGGKVRPSWSQQTIYDSVPFMQDLSEGSLLCQSHLMPGVGVGVSSSPSFPAPHHSSVLS